MSEKDVLERIKIATTLEVPQSGTEPLFAYGRMSGYYCRVN